MGQVISAEYVRFSTGRQEILHTRVCRFSDELFRQGLVVKALLRFIALPCVSGDTSALFALYIIRKLRQKGFRFLMMRRETRGSVVFHRVAPHCESLGIKQGGDFSGSQRKNQDQTQKL